MASKSDLELAKLLLSSRVLDEPQVRRAFEQQGQWLHEGRVAGLPEVLEALGLVPEGSLAALSAPGPETSQPFPNYRIDGVLGEGGMSTVYAATFRLNGARVALKVLKALTGLRPDFVARFEEEGRLLMRLDHPGIVAAFEAGIAGGYRFFSMDLIGGSTVQEVIEQRGHLTNAEALSITYQVAQALEYLHAQGMLHRDIKPGNIMVEPDGRARLIDLGLVGRLGGTSAEGEPANVHTVGTVEYLSPEQARGRADLDARSDIYSLGVSLYHMVVGEVPFQGASDMEVMAKQIMASMDHDKVKTRRISPELNFFIAKMTAKEREARFGSLAEVIREIGGYLPTGRVPVDLGAPPRVIPMGAPLASGPGAARTPGAPPTLRPVGGPPVLKPIAAPPGARPAAVPPTLRPVSVPTARPIAPAGGVPRVPPVVAPVARPIAPSAQPPSVAPRVAPVARPIAPPVLPPRAAPVVAPVARPLSAPGAPAKAIPVVAPVARPLTPSALPPKAAPVVAPVARPVLPPALPPKVAPAVPPSVRPVAPVPAARPVAPVTSAPALAPVLGPAIPAPVARPSTPPTLAPAKPTFAPTPAPVPKPAPAATPSTPTPSTATPSTSTPSTAATPAPSVGATSPSAAPAASKPDGAKGAAPADAKSPKSDVFKVQAPIPKKKRL